MDRLNECMRLIREHDQAIGTTLESVVMKIVESFVLYGDPKANPDDIRIHQADLAAAICELAISCTSSSVLSRVYDAFVWYSAEDRKKMARTKAESTLLITFVKKWADDLESSGKAKTRNEALFMACAAYYDLQRGKPIETD